MTRSLCLTVAALVLVLAFATANAHRNATGIVKQRMDAMTSIAGAMKALRAMMRGKQPYDVERVKLHSRTVAAHGGERMTVLFPEGSMQHPTRAKPSIWRDWDRFSAMARELARYADALAAAASNERLSARGGGGAGLTPLRTGSGDLAAAAPDAVFERLQRTCSDCHRAFREKSELPVLERWAAVPDPRAVQSSFERSSSLTRRGSALPPVDLITWPTKNPSRLVLPSR